MTTSEAGYPTATMGQFRSRARIAIEDVRLQGALEGATDKFAFGRASALAELPEADALRDHLKTLRSATLARLAEHLEAFEGQAQANGSTVHWAADAAEASQIVVDIARQRGATLATKTKSMATEEIGLNRALSAAGIEPVETDLGEWILQLAHESPYHIIAPAIHMTRGQVAELFIEESGEQLPPDDIPRLTATARRLLREKFLASGIGITGANIGVAETGTIVLVTNEGNAEMVTSLPPVHVVVIGIEKIAPTWDEAAPWLALLARSATGQALSVYTTFISGPARPEDVDGPEEVHIVLVDNQRSTLLGTTYEEVLQCIRCGACLNVCPVYREAGGHAYGSPYSGPIGAVISPLLFGREEYSALPQASSLCGACLDVCPARIDLPRLLLELRAEQAREHQAPLALRLIEGAAASVLGHERWWRWGTRAARLFQRPLARQGQLNLPAQLNPLGQRRPPALAPKSFRDLWADGEIDDQPLDPRP
ncbi:MAG: lactate utilization protein B [Candidatus Promineifilaceae bacterium]